MRAAAARAEELGGELRIEPVSGGGTRVLARLAELDTAART